MTVVLTQTQQAAIDHRGAHLQLIACAGSGKTEVVSRHVATILGQRECPPRGVIAFTFTEKAAGELKGRILDRTREVAPNLTGLADMFVGTIHAFCLNLLRTEVSAFLKYDVLNDVQQSLFVDRYSAQSGLTSTVTLQARPLRRYVDTKRYLTALSIIREEDVDEAAVSTVSVRRGLDAYAELLSRRGYFDYSSIMAAAVQELETNKALRDRLAARVRHVIVDEYQDVNPIQERVVRALADLGARLVVVGDDDQTVYQWRGGDVRNILTFADRYSPVEQIRLEDNYRSSRGVVETARTFISANLDRLPKEMKPTDAQGYEEGDLIAQTFIDPEAEADFIAQAIAKLTGVAFRDPDGTERGLAYSDMAILLRSVAQNGEPVIGALKAAGIPYIVAGMATLFDTLEAQAAKALFLMMGGDTVTPDQVFDSWVAADLGLDFALLRAAIEQAYRDRSDAEHVPQSRHRLYGVQRKFLDFLEGIQLREERVPNGRGHVVFYNLGKFSQAISDFESIHWASRPHEKYRSFADFLTFQAPNIYGEGEQDNAHANPNAVRVMTIHQAKGLEWPVVFMPALLRNRFPSSNRTQDFWQLLPKAAVPNADRYDGSIADERRLFYVGMTRSQKFLFLTWAPIAGKNNRYTRASEFWQDILRSKWVLRRSVDYKARPRLPSTPKRSIANVVFTFSELKYFFECPYQFKLRILYGFNAPIHEALGYGKSLHDALADINTRAIRGEYADVGDAPDYVATHLRLPFSYKALAETLTGSATRIVGDYIADNRTDFPNIEYSEQGIEIDLGDGVSVVGRIDLVRRRDTDETYIVDFKTKERVQAEEVTENQLNVYVVGYQELTGRKPEYVEVYDLDERRKMPRSVDQVLVDRVVDKVRDAAGALRLGTLDPAPSPAKCGACDFRRMCSAAV